jgi:hypothetical protein
MEMFVRVAACVVGILVFLIALWAMSGPGRKG